MNFLNLSTSPCYPIPKICQCANFPVLHEYYPVIAYQIVKTRKDTFRPTALPLMLLSPHIPFMSF